MNHIKELLALAPFVALAIAVTYLHGYWGTFGILALPYLSFQELLTYSAVPLFGFILAGLAGMVFGVLNQLANHGKQRNKWTLILENLAIITFCGVLIYFDVPEKWLFPPLVIFGFIALRILGIPAVQSARDSSPHVVLLPIVAVFLLIGSFGYGRAQAERLVRIKEPNITLSLDTGIEAGKLIGKLGTHYFFINSANHLTVLPERVMRRIEYNKEYKSGG